MNRHRGGRRGWRGRCEQSAAVDIRRLKARGVLRPGASFEWIWSQADQYLGSVQIGVGTHALELTYDWTPWDGPPRPIRCTVPFTWTSPHLGGQRMWLECPRCTRRCVAVYAGGRDFACRLCLRLGYLSESMSLLDRAWHRMHKLEARLAEDSSKPKRMRWATYGRICDQLEAVEERGDSLMLPGLQRLAARHGIEIDRG